MIRKTGEIIDIYKSIKSDIENQISNFRKIWARGTDEELFTELAFCILTPQSKARSGWQAICNLKKKGFLFDGDFSRINKELNIVRFKNKKTEYLINARNKFYKSNNPSLRERLNTFPSIYEKRDWLVREVKGYGFKEASHFLRNIGLGDEIAILDRHILKNLMLYNVIKEIPKSVTEKNYLVIENKLKDFAKDIRIPADHLDFVLWYKEAGEVFK